MEVAHAVRSKSTCSAEAVYPIDLWPAVDHSTLTSASKECPSSPEPNTRHEETWFKPSCLSKVEVTGSNVSRLLLFGDDQPGCTLLALHPPAEPTHVEALYLQGRWWLVDDVLRTSRKSRTGLLEVQSAMERVILFLLSQVVERRPGEEEEEEEEEAWFSPHPRTERAKLLWCDGKAVGFYTVKQKGSLCDGCTSQSYLLPVLDTLLVRRCKRRCGLGLQMLEDFCSSFPREEVLGVSHPLSPSMVGVCRKYLLLHEAQRERLCEAEAPGGWAQRRNIWLGLQLGRYAPRGVEEQSRPPLRQATRTEEEDRSHKLPCDSGPAAVASENPWDVPAQRPRLNPSDPGIESGNTSRAGSPLCEESSRTPCSPAARSDLVPDPGPLPGILDSVSSRAGPGISDSADPLGPRRRTGETLRGANSKRVRRSLD